VDFLAWELRPAALDDVGVEAALAEFVRQWSWASGVVADFHHTEVAGARLPPDIESNLYRIVQEAFNNISKHAKASHASLILERRADEVTLIIEDDGRGFDADVRPDGHRRMGLNGMEERAASIGGVLQLESSPGKGTTLFVRIPLVVPPTGESEPKRLK
jgi:signal transduction histidine kinase